MAMAMAMEMASFDLKINDLPKEIEIRIPDGANDEIIRQVIEDLKSEVIYNSRYNEENEGREPKIEIVNKSANFITIRIS